MPSIGHGAFFLRLAIATVLGFAIGLERQWRQRSAGLHTSTLVAVGAALFATLPELAGVNDAMRVAGQIVTGVGFLAGGVIVREGFSVRGLITAATLWSTAAVGVLAGVGFETQATVGAIVIIATNLVCFPLAEIVSRIPRLSERLATTYTMHIQCSTEARQAVRRCILLELATTPLTLATMSSSSPENGKIQITVELSKPGRDDGAADRLQASLESLDGVLSAYWDSSEKAA